MDQHASIHKSGLRVDIFSSIFASQHSHSIIHNHIIHPLITHPYVIHSPSSLNHTLRTGESRTGSLGRIRLAIALNLGRACASLALGHGIQDTGDVVSATPPGGFVCLNE